MDEAECLSCGELFAPRKTGGKPQVYCSATCRLKAIDTAAKAQRAARRAERQAAKPKHVVAPKPAICAECSQPITQPSNGRLRLYCSDQCRHRVSNRAQNRRRLPVATLPDRVCFCGRTFTPRRKDQVYCGQDWCAQKAYQQRRAEGAAPRWGIDFNLICVECGGGFVARRANAKWCSKSCRIRTQARDSSRRRGNGAAEDVPYIDRGIFERDRWKCHLCKGSIDPSLPRTNPLGATIDHLVPRSQGGADAPANVATAHLKCNLEKGVKPKGEQLRLI